MFRSRRGPQLIPAMCLTQRNYPVVSSANIRTSYSYDSAGRLQYETVTKETGSTTNLYRTGYAYSYLTYGRQVVRTEQDYSGGWNDSWRVTYQWDAMERQDNEEREDWSGSSWDGEYEILQQYDKNGNRTGKGNRPGMICDEIESQSRRVITATTPVRQRPAASVTSTARASR